MKHVDNSPIVYSINDLDLATEELAGRVAWLTAHLEEIIVIGQSPESAWTRSSRMRKAAREALEQAASGGEE